MSKPAAILDVGSSKLVCMVGSVSADGGMLVHGAAVEPYKGFIDGELPAADNFREKIIEVIERAEQDSRVRIREICVGVPAPFVTLSLSEGRVMTKERNHRVTEADLDELINAALVDAKKTDAVLMHSTPVSFFLDGKPYSELPVGEKGEVLTGQVSHMYVEQSFIELVETALKPIKVEVAMYLSATLASALAIIPEVERIRPAVMIDAGYEHTEICVIENAALTKLTTIPVGGRQFVSDLSFGLDIPAHYAEVVKRRFVFDQEPLSPVEIIRMRDEKKRVDQKVIALIMNARAGEWIDLVKEKLDAYGISEDANPATYLTGGGLTMVRGAADHIKKALFLPVKRDIPTLPEMDTPNYTSAFGALDFALRAMGGVYEEPEPPVMTTVMDKLRQFLKR